MKPGTILSGKYRLESVLGQGGMGSVWRAEHLGLKAPVAVKLMDPTVTQNADALGRFHREAHAAAMIRSPHVVQVLDHGVDEAHRTPFIVMELLEGETLGERLIREQVLSPERTAAILGDVCRALSRAHQAGIIHRDLKPDNIFLVTDDREYAKVVDFGVAKSRPYSIGGGGTRTGSLIGTPYYMSPEQISGSKQIDGRSDLWSVAVIACECITGRRPFQEETIGGLAIAICTRPVPRALTLGPVSPAFDAWLARALDREPEKRFQSAREQADALRDACAGCDKPIVKMPSGVREGTRFEEPDTLPGKRAPGPTLSGDTLDAAPTGRPAPPDEADSPTAPPLSNTFAALVLKGHPRVQMLSAGAGLGVALAVATWLAVDAARPLPKAGAAAARSGETVRDDGQKTLPAAPLQRAPALSAVPPAAPVVAPPPSAPAPDPALAVPASAELPTAVPSVAVPSAAVPPTAAVPAPGVTSAAALALAPETLAPRALLGVGAKPSDPAHAATHGAGHVAGEPAPTPHKHRAAPPEEPKSDAEAVPPAERPAHGNGTRDEVRDSPDPDIGGPDHPDPAEKPPPQDDPGDAPDSKAAVPKPPANVAPPKRATTASKTPPRAATLETAPEGERAQPKQ